MIKLRPNIRTQVVVSFISVIVLVGTGSIAIGVKMINDNIVRQAYDQVRKDIGAAVYIYEQETSATQFLLEHLSGLGYMKGALISGNRKMLYTKLAEARQELNIDFVNVTDPRGNIIARSGDPGSSGDSVASLQCIMYVMNKRKPCMGNEIVPQEILAREGDSFAQEARIRVIDTPRQRRNSEKKTEERALCRISACPVFSGGRMIGIIYGGRMINNRFGIVDRIKELLFKDEKIDGYDLGTATVFLDDVRVSTNVKRRDGSRSTGTRLSEEVYREVVKKGKLWLDKAFVVDKWYISAYTPLYDIVGKNVIGVLYVGALEEKYDRMKSQAVQMFVLLIVFTGLMALWLAVYLLKKIINPIKALAGASKAVASGDFTAKIESHFEGEMEELCRNFNIMVDAIEERDRQLRENSQRKIMQSEKLASVGRLASGIAHELNNPLTAILAYGNMMYEEMKRTKYGDDLKIVIDETLRCKDIVRGLLDFARETRLDMKPGDLNMLVKETLLILEKTYGFHNIRIEKYLDYEIPPVTMDVNQMKSVVSNLVLNARDAMPEGGSLSVVTRYLGSTERAVLEVADSGQGIKKENIGLIFDPFFTTKEEGSGTGLGLSVSHSIIEGHGGTIAVHSEEGKGTTFVVELPVKWQIKISGN